MPFLTTGLAGFPGAWMQGLVSVLVVAPESLMALVNGTLRLGHSEAMRYICLREDYGTARVDGRSLRQIFSQDASGALKQR